MDGHLMHIHCQGQGSPTVVVELGLGSVSSSWETIHQEIARTTRVCAYDRAGMGYSEPIGRPLRSTEVATLLHKLLRAAKVEDDLLLLGWSAGGVYIRDFYHQGPQHVKAMLLVDSSHEQQENRLPKSPDEGGGRNKLLTLAKYLAPFGLLRASGAVNNQFQSFQGPDELKSTLVALYNQSHVAEAMLNEQEAFSEDVLATQAPASLGSLPLIVISRGKPVELEERMSAQITLEYLQEDAAAWQELQLELTNLSTNGRQVIALESGHAIHSDQPELLIASLLELVQEVREQR